MSKKMLIDATHHEETRVAVTEGNRLEEFDYESTYRKALKGSIFLAKVTRVEPSLQAAFVNFGGNRHGFLPFSEIHPDYFRIPISDREALMAEQEKLLKEMDEEEEADVEVDVEDDEEPSDGVEEVPVIDEVDEIDPNEPNGNVKADDPAEELSDEELDAEAAEALGEADETDAEDEGENGNRGNRNRGRGGRGRGGRGRGRGGRAQNRSKGGDTKYDNMDDEQRFRFQMRRKYKIQEVIKRGQIMLVQVSKEERGNKGAAVGSYLSLPGRYCVLMPNSPRAGGVSRKISNYKDRAKMRELLKDLDVPKGMSVILRTAGVTRTKAEVKRDLEYLMRLWNNIRELTLESSAPALVYEEANLVKRAVRDLYTRDVEEIIVAGEEGYKTAKDFMKMMIPSHVKRVTEFKDDKASLFQKYGIESQIAEIGETEVRLKSGGYLVINPTEALVSIDVNSGKATKERHIEETALKTNLEAADEVARQLRLRDLGGLVVIDFIDMEDRRNNGKVERRMREALSGDRARIQVGRISSFGLMEMSRQRMNPSLTESQFETCPHCSGVGRVRTADAASIMLLRAIEEEAIKGRAAQIIVHVSANVALYMLNNKRVHLSDIEERYGLSVVVRTDDDLGGSGYRIEVSKPANKDKDNDDDPDDSEEADNNESNNRDGNRDSNSDGQDGNKGRRRGRRGGRNRGRGRGRNDDDATDEANADDQNDAQESSDQEEKPQPKESSSKQKDDEKTEDKPKKAPRGRNKKDDSDKPAEDVKADDAPKKDSKPTAKKPKPSNDDAKVEDEKPLKKAAAKEEAPKAAAPKDYETVNETPKTKKKGWWSK